MPEISLAKQLVKEHKLKEQKLKTILRKFALSQRVLRSLQLQFQSAALSLATAHFSGHSTSVKAITNISEILGENPHKINCMHCLGSETISACNE